MQLYAAFILILTAISGDILLTKTSILFYRALIDNVTHALIGGISWFMVATVARNRHATTTLTEIVLCTLLASLVDVDHLIMAKSLSLHDATNLKHRPPLHCSTLPLILCGATYVCGTWWSSRWVQRIGCLVTVAFISHHTRDATRRGYWFYPFGSTVPVPYPLYLGLLPCIPWVASYCLCEDGSAMHRAVEFV